MKRWAFFLYGVASHAGFLAVFALLACWIGNLFLPKTIDTPTGTPRTLALAIDLGLLALFAVQHSVMARPAFKRAWTKVIPQPIERSTYVLVSNLVVLLIMSQWRSLDHVVWDVQAPAGRAALWGLFAAGWLMVPVVSLMIDHFDLFGVRQVWLHLRDRPYEPRPFREKLLYRSVRHPLYVGWALAFWATPTMSLGHLLFAGTLTLYMALAARVEERDLVAHHGPVYAQYRRRVPMFVPRLGAARRPLAPETAELN
jgi:protein-S-isoprenylcysteine O-methyltransferase Ste14